MSKRLRYVLAILVLVGAIEVVLVGPRAWWGAQEGPAPRVAGNTRLYAHEVKDLPPPEPIPYRERDRPRFRHPLAGASRQPVSFRSQPPNAADLRAALKNANIIICVLDAARADHFSFYGYPRETTPSFDRLARQSVVFDHHFCTYPNTVPSTASLLTGQYPDTHGLRAIGEVFGSELPVLSPQTFTIEQAMARAGFQTLLFSSNQQVTPSMGIGSDFHLCRDLSPKILEASSNHGTTPGRPSAGDANSSPPPTAPRLVETAARDLKALRRSRFFAYLHFLPPHIPYEAPPDLVALYRGQRPPTYWEGKAAFTQVQYRLQGSMVPVAGPEWANVYDANLRWADQALGDLVRVLKQEGLFDNTLLVVTADHGEALREHAFEFHSACPYDEAIRIPLLVRFPGPRPPVGRVGALTQPVDLLPTLLDLCQIAYPEGEVQGKSLVGLLTGQEGKVRDYVFCRVSGLYPSYVVRSHSHALLLYQGGKLTALYDLKADPWQTRNVIGERPAIANAMKQAFRAFASTQRYPPLEFLDPDLKPALRTGPTRPISTVSEETRRQLRALGYIK
jgi:arylsulfatase A-like enzyme